MSLWWLEISQKITGKKKQYINCTSYKVCNHIIYSCFYGFICVGSNPGEFLCEGSLLFHYWDWYNILLVGLLDNLQNCPYWYGVPHFFSLHILAVLIRKKMLWFWSTNCVMTEDSVFRCWLFLDVIRWLTVINATCEIVKELFGGPWWMELPSLEWLVCVET